jgi:hypothetical protein
MAFTRGNLEFEFNNIKEVLKQFLKKKSILDDEKQKLQELQEKQKKDNLAIIEEMRLKASIEERENEIRKELESITYIRENATLRFQPNLDNAQTEIKISKLYDTGTLTIDGGPGTGKTTTLIQRLKYLIDRDAILEEGSPFILTDKQKEVLFDESRNWVFFSPNELLRLYLKKSMDYEGLTGIDDKVLVWNKQRQKLMSHYKLFNPDTQGPFQKYRGEKKNEEVFICEHHLIIKALNLFYLNYHKDILDNLSKIKTNDFEWHSDALTIKAIAAKAKMANKLEEIIMIYLNLSEASSDTVSSMLKGFSESLNNITISLQNNINKKPELSVKLEALLQEWNKEKDLQLQNNQNDDDELDDEDNETDETVVNDHYDYLLDLNRKLKSLIKKVALQLYDPSVKLSAKEKALDELLSNILKDLDLKKIGQAVFYQRHFDRFTKGIDKNMLSSIPTAYKAFRKEEYKASSDRWNLPLLKELTITDSNKRLHTSEQSLLIGFINNLLKLIYKRTKTGFKSLNHIYADEYKKYCRPVIGIDEVTDFSIIDIYAMHSLSHHEFSAVTLCGDPMQRLTKIGIKSWDEIDTIIPENIVKELRISYRQSPTLLKLAGRIFKDTLGYDPEYKAHLLPVPDEPQPLLYCSEDEDEKIRWIARRIIEVYKIYNFLPSIAIFIDKKEDIPAFVGKLAEFEELEDNGIEIKDCSNGNVLESKDTVRVFPVEVVKGLEFQVAFFHNIDKFYLKNASDKLMEKFLYVGLSRAAFFLGVTISNSKNESITKYFDTRKNFWKYK